MSSHSKKWIKKINKSKQEKKKRRKNLVGPGRDGVWDWQRGVGEASRSHKWFPNRCSFELVRSLLLLSGLLLIPLLIELCLCLCLCMRFIYLFSILCDSREREHWNTNNDESKWRRRLSFCRWWRSLISTSIMFIILFIFVL